MERTSLPNEEDLIFKTIRIVDSRGMEATVLCKVFDKEGNRIIWPTQFPKSTS